MSARPPQGPAKPKPFVLRDLTGGVNLATSRESIADNEAWWMEGLQPIAPGNTALIPQAGSIFGTGITDVTEPTYAMSFRVGGTTYRFIVFSASGNGWIGPVGGAFTKVFNATLTSGLTSACQWNKLGILIIDPLGYWDYGVTTAATLTPLSNTIQSVTITDPGSNFTTAPPTATLGGPGSGAVLVVYLGIGTPQINAAGSNYGVGDVLSLIFGFASVFGTVTVTSVNATGGVTGISVTTPGFYLNAPVGAISTTGGSGSGCTFNVFANVSHVVVQNGGSGYTGASTITFSGGTPTRQATATLNVSGSLTGIAIASYAGRAWIANGRSVTFTDAGSYNSFIGSGSVFTINDSYLFQNVTALYGANNYLYIFGDTSIDVLSNVTVTSAGTASFSRVNVSPSVGCSNQQSIFAYYRSIGFANPNGFFMLTGATVENISEGHLDLVIGSITQTTIAGFAVTVNNLLCAAWALRMTDNILSNGAALDIVFLYYRGRWFFSRQSASPLLVGYYTMRCATSSGSTTQGFIAHSLADTPAQQVQLFSNTGAQSWRLYTKLYDFGVPISSKQVTRTGFGFYLSGGSALGTNAALSIDTENGIGAAVTLQPATVAGYNQVYGTVQTFPAQSKYVGFGASYAGTDSKLQRFQWMAMEVMETNPWQ